MSRPPFRARNRLKQKEADQRRRLRPRVAVTTGSEPAKASCEATGRTLNRDERTDASADSAVPNITVTKYAANFGSPDRDGIARDC